MPWFDVFPEWFRFEAGFKFFDKDNNLCVLLGNGEFPKSRQTPLYFRDVDGQEARVGDYNEMVWSKDCLVYAYRRDPAGKWRLGDVMSINWSGARPFDAVVAATFPKEG